jgi:peptidyl-prolyl cis-trans isomerase A (cyclophilin A)
MAHTTPPAGNPQVAFETRYGRFVAQLYEKEAPISTANLLNRIEKGLLTNSSIYRIVTLANQPDTVPAKIEVVQFGLPIAARETDPLPPIAHEATAATGLRHLDGTLSMARLAPGTAGSAFFICIGDQPELDFGGHRNPDGQGFAAFGQIVDGMDVVRTIFAQAEDATDHLPHPIPIESVSRI